MSRVEISPLKKHIQESPKIQELRAKRVSFRRRLITLFSILLLTIIIGFIFFVQYPKYQLVTVVVSGNQIVSTEDITADVEQFLHGSYAYIIPHRNAFLYPKEKIVTSLQNSFPRLKNISVYRINHTTLAVVVTERRGYALWCGPHAPVIDMTAPCYFTDDTGKIISTAPYYSGNVYPRFFGGTNGSADPLGKSVVDEKQFQNLLAFSNRISGFGLRIKAIDLVSPSESNFVLDIGNQKTAIIRFIPTSNYTVLADNLAVALKKKEFADKIKKNLSSLEYFDLRFTNKVYYKFADAPLPTAAAKKVNAH
jgi:uncharacterized membrane protein (DUF485 family)